MDQVRDPDTAIVIPADLRLDAATALRDDLLARVAVAVASGGSVTVDLDGPDATAPALQLAVACRRSLAGGFAGFGAHAAAHLADPA